MSTTVDNRVVEMRFNNQQFERNAKESIGTLDKLKQALKFDSSSTRGLEELQRNTKNFNLDAVTKSVDKVSSRFDALGVVGMSVINRLTNAAIDFGKRAFSSMTGGLSGGFEKYSAMTDAVQVMVINSGKSIDYVNGLMAELRGYVDDTSYSFEQMTTAMGQFSAAGIELANAEEMVEGIANWAATAGVNAVRAQRAFQNVSQSIAKGYLELRDAQSLIELNMFTPDFKRLALATAAEFGTIRKEGDKFFADIGTGAKEKWVEVTESNLASTLKGKWFTTDVWDEVLHLYAEHEGALNDLDIALLEAAGLTEDFGETAFNAAYEAKTFSDAVGAVRDTLTTGWSVTFENIFGNYKEAAWFFTELASYFQDIVGSMAESRNELLSIWKMMGGRTRLIRAIFESFEVVRDWISPIASAFNEVFEAMDPERLYELTINLHEFIRSLRPSETQIRTLKDIFVVLFSAAKSLIEPLKILGSAFINIVGIVAKFCAGLAALIAYVITIAAESGVLSEIAYKISSILQAITVVILGLIASVIDLADSLYEIGVIPAIIDSVKVAFSMLASVVFGTMYTVVSYVSQFIDKIKELKASGINVFLYAFNAILDTISRTLSKVRDGVFSVFGFIVEKAKALVGAKKSLDTVADSEEKFYKIALKNSNAGNVFINLKNAIIDFATSVPERLSNANKSIAEFFGSLDKGALIAAGTGVAIVGLIKKFGSAKNATGFGGMAGAGGGILDAVLNTSGLAKKIALIAAFGGAAALLVKYFKKIKGAADSSKETTNLIDSLANSLNNFVKGAGGRIIDFVVKVGSYFGIAEDKIRGFFRELTLGKVILGSFAAFVLGTIVQLMVGLGGLPLLSLSLTRALWQVGSAIKNWSIWGVDTFGDTCMKIGKSLIYFAGAMWILAKVPVDRFNEVSKAMGNFLIALLAITGLSSLLALTGNLESVWEFGLALVALSGSLLIIVAAMKLLESVSEDTKKVVLVVGTIFAIFALLATLSSRNKKITRIIRDVRVGFTGLAIAIAALAIAIWRLSTIPADQLKATSKALGEGLLGFTALLATAVTVAALAKTSIPALAMLAATAGAFSVMVFALMQLSNSGLGIGHLASNLEKFAEIFAVMAFMFVGISKLTNIFKTAAKDAAYMGLALISVSVAMGILTGVLVLLSKVGNIITLEGVMYSIGGVAAMGFALMLAMKGFQGVGKEAAKASLALIPVVMVMGALASIGIIIGLIPDSDTYWRVVVAVGVLGLVIKGINDSVSKINPKTFWSLLAVIGIIGSIAGSLILLSKYGDIGKIGYIAEDMALVIAALGAVIYVTQQAFNVNNGIWKTVTAFAAAVGMIGIAIAAIGTVETDQAFIAAVGISMVLVAIAGAVKILSSFKSKKVNMVPVAAMIAALVPICIGLEAIARHNFLQIAAAAVGVSAVLMALAGTVKMLSSFRVKKVNMQPVVAMIAAIGVIGWSLSKVAGYNWLQIATAGAAISVTLLAFAGAFAIISSIKANSASILSMLGLTAALGVIAYSLWEIATYPWQQIGMAAVSINSTLIVVAAVFGVLSGIFGAEPQVFGVGAAIVVLAFMGIALACNVLADALIKILPSLESFVIKLAEAQAIVSAAVGILAQDISIAVSRIIESFGKLAIDIATAIMMVNNSITTLVLTLTAAFVTITTMFPTFAENLAQGFIVIGAGIGTGLATIITTFVSTLLTSIGSGIAQILGLIKSKEPEFDNAGSSIVGVFVDSMVRNFSAKHPVIGSIVTGIADIIRSKGTDEFGKAGKEATESFASSMEATKPVATKAATEVGKAWWDEGIAAFLGIGSFGAIDGSHGWGSNALGPAAENAFSSVTSAMLPSVAANGASIGSAYGDNIFSSGIPGIDNLVAYAAEKLGKLGKYFSFLGIGVGGSSPESEADKIRREDQERRDRELNQKEKLERAAYNNSLSDALDRDKTSFEDYQSMERNKILRNATGNWDFFFKDLEDATGDAIDGGGGGGGGSGGGGAAAAAEEAKELFDVWKDGGKVIQKVAENFGSAYEKLGYTHPLELGADAVQNLANKMWELAHTGEDATTLASYTTEEKLAEMKELFDNFYNDISETVQGAGDIFGKFNENASESIDEWIRNLDKQEAAIDNWVRHIEQLSARGASYDVVQQFIDWGPQEDARLRKLLASPEATFNKLSDRIVAYNDYNMETANERTERLYAALAATLIDKTEEASEEVTEITENTGDSIEESAKSTEANLERATNQYVVVNRNGATSIINEVGRVIKANGDLAQSAFDVAKVTKDALSEVEDAYITTKNAVLDAIGGSIDILSKFDTESEIDKDEMQETARETLKAWDVMYKGMGELAERGLSKDFITTVLVPMGESAYGYVQAMLEMTQDEIDGWNSMFAQAASLPATLAEQLATDVANATLLASQNIVAGLGNEATYQAAKDAASGIVSQMINEINGNNGASAVGEAVTQGTASSIEQNNSTVTNAGVQAMNESVRVWKAGAAQDGWEVGKEFQAGRAQGILDNQYLVDEAFDTEYDETMDGVEDNYGIASPSKVFARIGKFLDLGLAKGIVDNIRVVKDASEISGNSAIDSMKAVVGHISDIINGEVQVDPTIRPVLDLSGVEGGAAAIDSMFGGTSYSLTRGVDAQTSSGSINDLINQMLANQMTMTPATAGSPINMYVYAAPGQSEEEIANIVEQKIMFRINRQGGVWR